MVEYVTKEEVYGILKDIQMETTRQGNEEASSAVQEAMNRVKHLYAVRNQNLANWKTVGGNREVIYCGNCAYKTLAYKNTMFCPNCGRAMLNGVRR